MAEPAEVFTSNTVFAHHLGSRFAGVPQRNVFQAVKAARLEATMSPGRFVARPTTS